MTQEAKEFAERVESEREQWREYQRNRRETEIECPECGGKASVTTVLGQRERTCHEKDCLYWEVLDE